jgi:hypothetical protein
MRNMNCRNVRREIEETEAGERLSPAAREHVATCAACETLSREQASLQALVSSLGTVEAPGDFDFRLRARLAGAKAGNGRYYALSSFSFGLRAGAMATVLLLLGAAFVFVTFKTQPNGPAGGETVAVNADKSPALMLNAAGDVNAVVAQPVVIDAGMRPADSQAVKRRGTLLAAARNNRSATFEEGQSAATILRPDDPDDAFLINASNQSLRVSVDDARGASRTISLPTVSFGSQKALSQSATPLMASARGAW